MNRGAALAIAALAAACGSGAGARDAAIADAGAGAAACAPGDAAGFTPAWRPPSARRGACTTQQIADLYGACLAPTASKSACAAFQAGANACAACVLTKSDAPALGPVVVWPSSVELDFAGCVALVDPGATSCAEDYQADVACTHAACDGRCPNVVDTATSQLYASCLEAADTAACAPFATKARCAFDAADGGDAARCMFAGTTFAELYAAIAPIFCGP